MRVAWCFVFASTAVGASVQLHWLDGKAPATTPAGTAFGLPWVQGSFKKNDSESYLRVRDMMLMAI